MSADADTTDEGGGLAPLIATQAGSDRRGDFQSDDRFAASAAHDSPTPSTRTCFCEDSVVPSSSAPPRHQSCVNASEMGTQNDRGFGPVTQAPGSSCDGMINSRPTRSVSETVPEVLSGYGAQTFQIPLSRIPSGAERPYHSLGRDRTDTGASLASQADSVISNLSDNGKAWLRRTAALAVGSSPPAEPSSSIRHQTRSARVASPYTSLERLQPLSPRACLPYSVLQRSARISPRGSPSVGSPREVSSTGGEASSAGRLVSSTGGEVSSTGGEASSAGRLVSSTGAVGARPSAQPPIGHESGADAAASSLALEALINAGESGVAIESLPGPLGARLDALIEAMVRQKLEVLQKRVPSLGMPPPPVQGADVSSAADGEADARSSSEHVSTYSADCAAPAAALAVAAAPMHPGGTPQSSTGGDVAAEAPADVLARRLDGLEQTLAELCRRVPARLPAMLAKRDERLSRLEAQARHTSTETVSSNGAAAARAALSRVRSDEVQTNPGSSPLATMGQMLVTRPRSSVAVSSDSPIRSPPTAPPRAGLPQSTEEPLAWNPTDRLLQSRGFVELALPESTYSSLIINMLNAPEQPAGCASACSFGQLFSRLFLDVPLWTVHLSSCLGQVLYINTLMFEALNARASLHESGMESPLSATCYQNATHYLLHPAELRFATLVVVAMHTIRDIWETVTMAFWLGQFEVVRIHERLSVHTVSTTDANGTIWSTTRPTSGITRGELAVCAALLVKKLALAGWFCYVAAGVVSHTREGLSLIFDMLALALVLCIGQDIVYTTLMPSVIRDAITTVPFGLDWLDLDRGAGWLFLLEAVTRPWLIMALAALIAGLLGTLVWC